MEVEFEHVQLDFISNIRRNVVGLEVQKNIMCFGFKTGELFVIELDRPSEVFVCNVALSSEGADFEQVSKLWMNSDGNFLVIKTSFCKYHILDVDLLIKLNSENKPVKNGAKLVCLWKLSRKNCDITFLTWIDKSTFVCGTVDGHVFHVVLARSSQENKSIFEHGFVTLVKLKDRVDGLHWDNDGNLLVASNDKISYWHNASTDALLTALKNGKKPVATEEFEHIHRHVGNKFATYKNKFAWIINTGVVFGSTSTNNVKKNYVLSKAKVLLNVELSKSQDMIRDVILTEFHIIILRGSTLTIVSQLDNSVQFEEVIRSEEHERLIALTADYSQTPPTFWCHSSSNIYEIIISNESKSVWKLLCDRKKYDKALNLFQLGPQEKNMIYYYKATDMLAKKKFDEAATCFGLSSHASFGSVALELMSESPSNFTPLKIYLETKLNNLARDNEVQRVLLGNWIIWIYLNQLNSIDEEIACERKSDQIDKYKSTLSEVKSDLKKFIKSYHQILNKNLVYQLFLDQNRRDELIFFASTIKDFDYILSYWLEQENWYEALKILSNFGSADKIYKTSSLLLIKSPGATVDVWKKLPELDSVKLIPACLAYFTHYKKSSGLIKLVEPKENFALSYLQWSLKASNSDNAFIYNTVIYMKIASFDMIQDADNYQNDIIKFLKANAGKFDTNFVLRLSLKFDTVKVSTYLYSKLKSFDDAVTLALENDMIADAIEVVNEIDRNSETKLVKSLWLKIAKAMLYNNDENHDIRNLASQILKDSNEILDINDLLDLFDEFTTVANLKEELIRSLEKHGQDMSQLSDDIKQYIKIKSEILEDTKKLKERYKILKPGVSCDSCSKILQTKHFFVFPCTHSFHEDCLAEMILDSNDYVLKSAVEEQQRLIKIRKSPINSSKYQDTISKKCPLCSDIAINKIDNPLPVNEAERSKWIL